MNEKAGILAGALLLCTSGAAHAAGVDLIARGSIASDGGDRSAETAALLENGIPGNLFGGIGSGLGHAGGDIFCAVPDRGPNAKPWNAKVDDTTSYLPRFHTLRLNLRKNGAKADLPYSLDVDLRDTTLFWTREALTYGAASVALGVGDGTPALNHDDVHYFSGRSDAFDSLRPSTWPSDGRFDPESIQISPDGERLYVSDEYGPFVYEFDRATGQRVRAFGLPSFSGMPDSFAIANLSPHGDDEINVANNPKGRIANKGMEGLALSPDGRTLYGCMQSPLEQDGGTDAKYVRIIKIDIETGATWEHAYPLTNIGTAAKPKYPTVSECVAVNGHELLIDERDGKGLGDNSVAVFKKVYHVDLAGAGDVSGISGAANLGPWAVAKTELLDIVAVLGAHGIPANRIPAKLEGLAFGEDLKIDGEVFHTLFVSNDNDYTPVTAEGVDNPNQFFVFAIPADALPGFAQ